MHKCYAATIASLLIVLTTLIAVAPAFASTPHQDSATIQQTIEEWFTANQALIEQAELNYAGQAGVYGQLLDTDSTPIQYSSLVADSGGSGAVVINPTAEPAIEPTAEPLPDQSTVTPTDGTTSWIVLAPEVVQQRPPATIAVDVYSGTSGSGYVIRLSYCVDGICYQKAINNGPEQWRSYDWIEMLSEAAQ